MLCWIWEPIYEKCQWWILPILQCQVRNQQECRLWYVQTCTLIPGSCRLIFWRSHFEKSEKWILKFPWALWVQMSSLEFSWVLWVQMSSLEFPWVPVTKMGSCLRTSVEFLWLKWAHPYSFISFFTIFKKTIKIN